jgi:hypothetical protein
LSPLIQCRFWNGSNGREASTKGRRTVQGLSQNSGDQVVAAEPLADGDLNINLNDSRILTSQALSEFLSREH